jgi:hypothetical protein
MKLLPEIPTSTGNSELLADRNFPPHFVERSLRQEHHYFVLRSRARDPNAQIDMPLWAARFGSARAPYRASVRISAANVLAARIEFKPRAKRAARFFSAFASLSNHSAISGNPSSRATFGKESSLQAFVGPEREGSGSGIPLAGACRRGGQSIEILRRQRLPGPDIFTSDRDWLQRCF